MSQRRMVLRLEDGGVVELTWEQGAKKFTLEIDEHPAPTTDSSAETAKPAAVSPEPPVATPETRTELEQQVAKE